MTQKNYQQLQSLYEKYGKDGFRIAAFPSNQFGSQEPWPEDQIKAFAVKEFGVTFDLYAKIDVNGESAHPLFKFLKQQQAGSFGDFIKWNFGKFLVDREGQPVNRYAPTTAPNDIEGDILKLLKQEAKPKKNNEF